MKMLLNTDLINLIDCNLYNSTLGDIMDNKEDDSRIEIENCIINKVMEFYTNAIKQFFPSIIISNAKYYHPKYYNYDFDVIDFEIEIDNTEWENMLSKIDSNADADFFEWLKSNYKSYDGYINFFPTNKKEFFNYYNDKNKSFYSVSAFLNYLLKDTKNTSNFYENLCDYIVENY